MLVLGFVLGVLTALGGVCALAAWVVRDITE